MIEITVFRLCILGFSLFLLKELIDTFWDGAIHD